MISAQPIHKNMRFWDLGSKTAVTKYVHRQIKEFCGVSSEAQVKYSNRAY